MIKTLARRQRPGSATVQNSCEPSGRQETLPRKSLARISGWSFPRREPGNESRCTMNVFDTVRTVLAVRAYKDMPVPADIVRKIVEIGLADSQQPKRPALAFHRGGRPGSIKGTWIPGAHRAVHRPGRAGGCRRNGAVAVRGFRWQPGDPVHGPDRLGGRRRFELGRVPEPRTRSNLYWGSQPGSRSWRSFPSGTQPGVWGGAKRTASLSRRWSTAGASIDRIPRTKPGRLSTVYKKRFPVQLLNGEPFSIQPTSYFPSGGLFSAKYSWLSAFMTAWSGLVSAKFLAPAWP